MRLPGLLDGTPFFRSLAQKATAAAVRTLLGVGTGDTPTFAGLTSNGNILPNADNTRTLGSSSLSWTSIFIGGNGNEPFDEYDKGTFTPTVLGAGGTNVHTYAGSSQLGRYTRHGDDVLFELYVAVSAFDAGFAGSVSIGGLPFTSLNTNHGGAAEVVNLQNLTFAGGDKQLMARVNPNATAIGLFFAQSGAAQQDVDAGDLAATFVIGLSGKYEAA